MVEIGDEAGVGRLPSEDSPGREVGRRVVEDDHHGEEPEVRFQPVGRDARGRYAQVIADALGDLTQRDAFVPDRVPPGTCRCVLERQAVEVTDVECVPGGPPVGSVPGVARDAVSAPGRPVPGAETWARARTWTVRPRCL